MIIPAKQKILHYTPKPLLQQPFELLLGFMCLIAGIQHFINTGSANPLEALLPSILVAVWNFCLGVGGGLVVLGIIKNLMYVERAGLSLLGPSSLVYAIILIAYIGIPALLSIIIIIAFSLACFIKDFTIKIATLSIAKIFKEVPYAD